MHINLTFKDEIVHFVDKMHAQENQISQFFNNKPHQKKFKK